jgi:hypothetical protein
MPALRRLQGGHQVKITKQFIKKNHACWSGQDRFAAQFPQGVTITPTLWQELKGFVHITGDDVRWVARRILSSEDFEIFDNIMSSTWLSKMTEKDFNISWSHYVQKKAIIAVAVLGSFYEDA